MRGDSKMKLRIMIQKTDVEKSKEFGSYIDLVIDDERVKEAIIDKGLKELTKQFKKQLLKKHN